MSETVILVIEDEADIRELVEYNLKREGYQVISARSGLDGLKLAEQKMPTLVLLDLMLPDVDGLTVCRRLKSTPATQKIPVVMLTAKTEEADIVSGLEVGADDYITKPFSPRVLIARLRAVLRRDTGDSSEAQEVIYAGEIRIDSGRHETTVSGKRIELTSTEFRLLYLLAGRPGWVFSRDQIVDAVRGDDTIVTDRTVDVHIAGLRKKLGPKGKQIETVRGVGYRFREE